MACIWFITYCLPVSPMVTTTMSEAVPITMPSAVRAKRTLLVRKESMAMLTISLKSMVWRAVSATVSAKGVVMKILFHIGEQFLESESKINSKIGTTEGTEERRDHRGRSDRKQQGNEGIPRKQQDKKRLSGVISAV